MTTIENLRSAPNADLLRRECADFVQLPGEPDYDRHRAAWNLAVSQRPAAVAAPRTVEQLRQVVLAAARAGLRVTVQATGHAAAALGGTRLDDVVLVRTGNLRGVHVDPETRTARVEAGACWDDVIEVAARHGLTALHGSAPDVGVVGFALGGGLGWYARKYGLAANSIVAVELVLADGEVIRADAQQHTDLFWALRGGVAGNFGIVTTVELALLPIADVYAGMMLWDIGRTPEVLRAFAAWSPTAPEEITTSLRVMRFPPIPELPDFLRGRSVVILDGAALLEDEVASAELDRFRALGPELDTFARVPAASITRLHMDPEQPTPGVGTGLVLDRLDDDAVAAFLRAVGPEAETGVFIAELRQLGGAVARSEAGAGALDRLDGSHAMFLLAGAPTPAAAAAGVQAVDEVVAALTPWRAARQFANFVDRPMDLSTAFDDAGWERLRAVRRQADPEGRFLAQHAIDR